MLKYTFGSDVVDSNEFQLSHGENEVQLASTHALVLWKTEDMGKHLSRIGQGVEFELTVGDQLVGQAILPT